MPHAATTNHLAYNEACLNLIWPKHAANHNNKSLGTPSTYIILQLKLIQTRDKHICMDHICKAHKINGWFETEIYDRQVETDSLYSYGWEPKCNFSNIGDHNHVFNVKYTTLTQRCQGRRQHIAAQHFYEWIKTKYNNLRAT